MSKPTTFAMFGAPLMAVVCMGFVLVAIGILTTTCRSALGIPDNDLCALDLLMLAAALSVLGGCWSAIEFGEACGWFVRDAQGPAEEAAASMTEGDCLKGGQNETPTTPRPTAPPAGQGGKPKE